MSTYNLRQELIKIARKDVGKVEVTKNQAPFIKKLWPATTYPEGYENREPYCAAGIAYCVQQWLLNADVRNALGLTEKTAEKWRCKSAAVTGWIRWAKDTSGVKVLPRSVILHAGDLAVYKWENGSRHIETVVDDDNTKDGPFVAIGYNTDEAGSRDGQGTWQKPRSRSQIECFIRMLP
jgi:hypothetical protein